MLSFIPVNVTSDAAITVVVDAAAFLTVGVVPPPETVNVIRPPLLLYSIASVDPDAATAFVPGDTVEYPENVLPERLKLPVAVISIP